MKQPVPELLRGKYMLRINLELEKQYQRILARCHASLPARSSRLARWLGLALPSQEEARERIRRENIVQILTAGPEEATRILEYVSEPWRSVFLGFKPKGIEEIARLVALNLDWYLVPPKSLLRPEWVALVGAVVGTAALIAAITALFLSGSSSAFSCVPAIVLFGLLCGLWPGALGFYFRGFHRQAYYLDALRKEIRELSRSAHGPGMPDGAGEARAPVAGELPQQDVATEAQRVEDLLDAADERADH